MKMLRYFATAVLALLFSIPALADNPVVYNTTINYNTNQITVVGKGFKPASAAPTVKVNNEVLTLSTSSDTSFVAALPADLTLGEGYLLKVINSDSSATPFIFGPCLYSTHYRILSSPQ